MRTCLQNKSVQTQRFFYTVLRKAVIPGRILLFQDFRQGFHFGRAPPSEKLHFRFFIKNIYTVYIFMKKKAENPLF